MPSAITTEERTQLLEIANQLEVLRDVLRFTAADAPSLDTLSNISAADLHPTGNLSMLPTRIRDNSPITDAQLSLLITDAQHDVKMNSRFNGLLTNATVLIKTVRTTVLPLLL